MVDGIKKDDKDDDLSLIDMSASIAPRRDPLDMTKVLIDSGLASLY